MDKEEGKRIFVLLLVFSTFLGGLGQLIFKEGLDSHGLSLAGFVLLGFVIYGISTIAYFYALSRKSLSWAYSFGGLSYIFASVFAYFFLGEAITPLRWIGIAIIALGTAIIGLS